MNSRVGTSCFRLRDCMGPSRNLRLLYGGSWNRNSYHDHFDGRRNPVGVHTARARIPSGNTLVLCVRGSVGAIP